MDSEFQEHRDAIKPKRFSSSSDQFKAGVNCLGMGVLGGLTGIVTQPVKGGKTAGVSVSALS